jgi:hypothetical protein
MAAVVAALGGRVVVRVEEVANKPSDFKVYSVYIFFTYLNIICITTYGR